MESSDFFFNVLSTAAAKSCQSCPTLWDPIDGSPPGSPIPGILQARTLEWVAISFSNNESESYINMYLTHPSQILWMLSQGCELVIEIIMEHPLYTEVGWFLFFFFFSFPVYLGGGGGLVATLCLTIVTLWTVAYQGPLSMDFSSRQEY